MDSPVVVTAYYVQNLIQLLGPEDTSKILDKLRQEKLFSSVDDNLEKLALKVAKDGKKVSNLSIIKKGIGSVIEKTQGTKLSKIAYEKTKNAVKKVRPKSARTVVGIIGKKVPIISVGVGAGLALWRILENPHSEEVWLKAGAELASGTASCFPGIGTAVSMTIDGLLVAADRETSKKQDNDNEYKDKNDDKEELQTKDNNNTVKNKKHKVSVPSLYMFAYQGNDICHVKKLDHTFRVPYNFEVWFFCLDESVVPNSVQVDVLFYSMIAKEASMQKINYIDCVTPSNCIEKLAAGEICNNYKITVTNKNAETSLVEEFYLGLVKWSPKFERSVATVSPINEGDIEYFMLSQLICDIGRKENINQKCILMFVCHRTDLTDCVHSTAQLMMLWRGRVKELIPGIPFSDDVRNQKPENQPFHTRNRPKYPRSKSVTRM